VSIISISKFRRRIRLSKKKFLKDKYNYSPKVAIYVDPIELDRFTPKMVEAFTEYMERRNAILSKININKSTGIASREWKTESRRVDSIYGESVESEQSGQSEDSAKTT
jgi:hypothetical protein